MKVVLTPYARRGMPDPFERYLLDFDDDHEDVFEERMEKVLRYWNNNRYYAHPIGPLIISMIKDHSRLLAELSERDQRRALVARLHSARFRTGDAGVTALSRRWEGSATRFFGIDLGMTESCVAYVGPVSDPVVAHNIDGTPMTPPVVMFNEDGTYAVGEVATRVPASLPSVVSRVKRHMEDPAWRLCVDGKPFTAPDVSAKILEALVQDASKVVSEEIRDVVITVPAYFGMAERDATRLAGQIAGLSVVDIINEPTAAALAPYWFGRTDESEETVLVYDLGGSTFDVSGLAIDGGRISALSIDREKDLGGDDWDQRLFEIVPGKFMDENPDADDPPFDPSAMAAIQLECEEAKRKLSTTQSARLGAMSGATMAMIEVTRKEFEDATRELLSTTFTRTNTCLEDTKRRGVSHVDGILLVGGASLMLPVATALREEPGIEPQLKEPQFAVAKGAALCGRKVALDAPVIDISARIDR